LPTSVFSDDEEEPGWKVVLRTEVRGRRIDNELEEEDEPEMFAMGRDADFAGLRMAVELSKVPHDPLPGGRDIPLNQVVEDRVEEHGFMFDRDIGESTEDED